METQAQPSSPDGYKSSALGLLNKATHLPTVLLALCALSLLYVTYRNYTPPSVRDCSTCNMIEHDQDTLRVYCFYNGPERRPRAQKILRVIHLVCIENPKCDRVLFFPTDITTPRGQNLAKVFDAAPGDLVYQQGNKSIRLRYLDTRQRPFLYAARMLQLFLDN